MRSPVIMSECAVIQGFLICKEDLRAPLMVDFFLFQHIVHRGLCSPLARVHIHIHCKRSTG